MLGILLPGDHPDATAKADAALAACASLPGTTSLYRSLGPDDDWTHGGPSGLTTSGMAAGMALPTNDRRN
jgi:hypothetical protein